MERKGRTRREALPEFLGLLWVIEGEGVQVTGAPDLEFGLGLAASDSGCDLLYPRLYSPEFHFIP